MSRMPRIFLFAALCVLPSIACGQIGPAAAGDDDAKPAPGEPGGGFVEPAEAGADDVPQRFQRTPDAIPGTELGDATSEPPTVDSFDAQAAFEELESRISTLEGRLNQQVARLEDLEQTSMKLAAADKTTTTRKPPSPTDADAADVSPTGDGVAELAKLRGELEKLRADYGELFVAVADQTTAINNHAQGLSMHSEEIKAQDQKLSDATQKLQDLETGQQTLAAQLRDAALGGSSGGAGAPNILGNMQADPELRSKLYGNMRYRLRIHNTAGVELPISVNGVQWTVRADEWTFVPVPYGPVTVHRPGSEPVEIAEDQINWKADSRGFYVNYDYDSHQVADPSAG